MPEISADTCRADETWLVIETNGVADEIVARKYQIPPKYKLTAYQYPTETDARNVTWEFQEFYSKENLPEEGSTFLASCQLAIIGQDEVKLKKCKLQWE